MILMIMKRFISIGSFLILFIGVYFMNLTKANARTEMLGHWIDVYDGHEEPQYAVCAGSGEDCIEGDVKDYPDPIFPILT